jgi:exopolysaccharide biosynthesis predicted pyruvyltransferase EpsI/glycosyltransferase involved in cell wall biosynthesis
MVLINSPLVSVIIPIYNVEQYLEQCLVSVIHQTYKNIEIILVNDGSLDNSLEICKQWEEKDSRIRIIDKVNGGLSDARNVGLSVSKGELILFVDSDDWISINMVENMINEMQKSDTDLVVCDFIKAYPDGNMQKNISIDFPSTVISVERFLELSLEDNLLTSHVWRRLYKKQLLIENLFPKGKNFEDIFVVSKIINGVRNVSILNDALYFYRMNPSGIVSDINYKNTEDHLEATIFMFSEIVRLYPRLKSTADSMLPKKLKIIFRDAQNIKSDDSRKALLIKRIKKLLKPYSLLLTKDNSTRITLLEVKYFNYAYPFYSYILQNTSLKKVLKKIFSLPKSRKLNKDLKYSNSNCFWILGAPRYGNLGDLALLQGEKEFIKKFFPDYEIKEVPGGDLHLIKSGNRLNNNSIYAIQAGGNIGTLYPGIHSAQELALENINSNHLLIFPQTFFFDLSTTDGLAMLSKSNELYRKKNIQLFTRDDVSYNFISEKFNGVNVSLVPDIALMIDGSKYSKPVDERKGLFLCLRNDIERTLSNEKLDYILNTVENHFDDIVEGDTHRYNDDVDNDTFKYVEPLLEKIGAKRMMLTDRLHGMIFAAITNTPCIVITSKSPKVKGVYQWIKHLPYIELVENLEELDNAINCVLAIQNPKFDNSNLMREFNKMANIIKTNLRIE